MEKSKGMEKRGGNSSKEQMARDKLHSFPINNPSVYRGKAEGIGRKESLTL